MIPIESFKSDRFARPSGSSTTEGTTGREKERCLTRPILESGAVLLFSGLFVVLLVTGCAGTGSSLSNQLEAPAVKEFLGISQYYVKSRATVWAMPDRSSDVQGRVSVSSKVTEVTRSSSGWSKIRTAEGNLEGWLPTSLLSKEPVSTERKASKDRSGKSQQKHVEGTRKEPPEASATSPRQKPSDTAVKVEGPAQAEPQSEQAPASAAEVEKKGRAPSDSKQPPEGAAPGGLFDPPPARAETAPSTPPKGGERKGSPDIFDPF